MDAKRLEQARILRTLFTVDRPLTIEELVEELSKEEEISLDDVKSGLGVLVDIGAVRWDEVPGGHIIYSTTNKGDDLVAVSVLAAITMGNYLRTLGIDVSTKVEGTSEPAAL